MRFPFARFIQTLVCVLSTTFLVASANAESPVPPKEIKSIKSHAIALRGTPHYPKDFKHWEYVNPDAPQGGELKLGSRATYDNFNRFAQRGSAPIGSSDFLFDSLMTDNSNEISVSYGLIAESVEYAEDHSWIIFDINPAATFSDGKPITAEDVKFSFFKFYEQGVPQFKQYYKDVKPEILGKNRIKFSIPNPSRELMMGIGGLTILPEHYFKDKDLSQPFKEPPVGSGAYTVGDYKMGQYIVYERNKKYWARNHPTQIGQNNFDRIRYDFYLDETVLFEAFKKGEYDFRQENISKNWATMYKGDLFSKQLIVKEEIPHEIPQPNQAYVFNIKKPQFQNRDVRKALNLLFDFEWTNKNLFYNAYARNQSYFINTPYASTGVPTGRELEILKQYKDKLPPELFTQPFTLNQTDGSGSLRKEIRQALKLFKKAGYTLKNKKLVDKNGKQFEFELLMYAASSERIAIPFQKNIEKIGAKMNIRLLSDVAQFTNRMRERDYDMMTSHLGGGAYPAAFPLMRAWHSDYLDSTYNSVGTTDPLLDDIIMKIKDVQENEPELLAYGRAFDRILLWQYYCIPQWHISNHRIAYWNKFSRPDKAPKYDLGIETWWYDSSKATQLASAKE